MNLSIEKIAIYKGDITKMGVDAIINAANPSLLGGSGVDGAIHLAAGPGLLAECKTLRGCAIGSAKITAGYNLPAPYIIHTVGPIWQGGNVGEAELLGNCYQSSLTLALNYKLTTVAFPAIATGIYGYPKETAAKIAITTVVNFLQEHREFHKIYFVVYDATTEEIYQEQLAKLNQ